MRHVPVAPSSSLPPSALLLGALASLAGATLPGCLQNVSTGTGTTDTSSPGTSGSTNATATGIAAGTGCGQAPATGVTLCFGVDACPSIKVDSTTLPSCGFRPTGSSLMDLECICGDALCPIGVPTTCDQAAQLLSTATSLTVCQEVASDRCTRLGAPDAGTSGTSSPASSCDRSCESECAGEPDCIQLCGC